MSTKDMMPHFDLFQPSDMENALDLLDQYQDGAWPLAGGQDSLDWFKDRIKRPVAVIDLTGIPGMTGINETAEGIEIGALTTLTEIADSPLIKASYGVLAEAASRVASPQIRNIGTLGGNVSQDVRCWYYRSGVDCYRAGGNTCYADTPEGMNREHCLFGADRCVAVTPSDTAPALVALEAIMVIQSSAGIREVAAENYFIGPNIDIERTTVLESGDILTSIKIPAKWAGANYYFEKVADRATWDFALVNIASVLRMNGNTIEDLRIVCGGVECIPRRLNGVEDIARGSSRDTETLELAAGAAARGATTLNYNHFKVPLMQNLVKRAIRDS